LLGEEQVMRMLMPMLVTMLPVLWTSHDAVAAAAAAVAAAAAAAVAAAAAASMLRVVQC
jgi:hypothetical protein